MRSRAQRTKTTHLDLDHFTKKGGRERTKAAAARGSLATEMFYFMVSTSSNFVFRTSAQDTCIRVHTRDHNGAPARAEDFRLRLVACYHRWAVVSFCTMSCSSVSIRAASSSSYFVRGGLGFPHLRPDHLPRQCVDACPCTACACGRKCI